MKKQIYVLAALLCVFAVAACSPEVGSKEWCDQLKEKPNAEWNSNEASGFAKSCVFK